MAVPGRRLRIAVLNRVFSPTGGGAERYSIALVEQLAQRHDIHVFAQLIDHQWPGVSYHRIPTPFVRPRWVNQLWYAAATWWATRRGFDLVHSHENTWHGQVQTIHVMPVKYKLLHGRSGWAWCQGWLRALTSPRLWAYLMFERARLSGRPGRHRVVVSSASLGQALAIAYPRSVQTPEVLTPGVQMVGSVSATQRVAARQELGLPLGGTCLLFVGHDYGKKGLAALLKVMPALPAEVLLMVVGNPTQAAVFRDLASNLGIASRVYFLGSLKDISPVYSAADILVHPTLEDTFGMVVLEAMAHGLPVIVSNERYCGISALLADRGNALLLNDPEDVAEMGDILNDLVRDVASQQRLGRAAIAFARLHDWPAIAAQQETIYQSVCEPVA